MVFGNSINEAKVLAFVLIDFRAATLHPPSCSAYSSRAYHINVYEKTRVNYTSLVPEKPKCFVIAPIGKEGSDERKNSDNVLKYIVEKTLEDKYEVKRADDIRQPGTVTVQIIEQLLEAPLVVADLSGGNPNVYYELAIRHAVRKPVVHLITKGQPAPFDVSQMRYISYEITDPGSIENAQQQLRDNVQAIESGVEVLTPIQFTEFVLAAQSGQKGDRDTALILSTVDTAMSNISEELKSIKELVARSSQPAEVPQFLWTGPGSGKSEIYTKAAADWIRRNQEKKD